MPNMISGHFPTAPAMPRMIEYFVSPGNSAPPTSFSASPPFNFFPVVLLRQSTPTQIHKRAASHRPQSGRSTLRWKGMYKCPWVACSGAALISFPFRSKFVQPPAEAGWLIGCLCGWIFASPFWNQELFIHEAVFKGNELVPDSSSPVWMCFSILHVSSSMFLSHLQFIMGHLFTWIGSNMIQTNTIANK